MIVHSGSNRPLFCTVRAQREKMRGSGRDESSKSFGISELVDVAGIEPPPPCLQRRQQKSKKVLHLSLTQNAAFTATP
jgi:hypothetical protein